MSESDLSPSSLFKRPSTEGTAGGRQPGDGHFDPFFYRYTTPETEAVRGGFSSFS